MRRGEVKVGETRRFVCFCGFRWTSQCTLCQDYKENLVLIWNRLITRRYPMNLLVSLPSTNSLCSAHDTSDGVTAVRRLSFFFLSLSSHRLFFSFFTRLSPPFSDSNLHSSTGLTPWIQQREKKRKERKTGGGSLRELVQKS